MPLCKTESEKHIISQEEHWAKLVVWAVEKILDEGRTITWRHIRDLTNMRNTNFVNCLCYVGKYTDDRLKEDILFVIKGTKL